MLKLNRLAAVLRSALLLLVAAICCCSCGPAGNVLDNINSLHDNLDSLGNHIQGSTVRTLKGIIVGKDGKAPAPGSVTVLFNPNGLAETYPAIINPDGTYTVFFQWHADTAYNFVLSLTYTDSSHKIQTVTKTQSFPALYKGDYRADALIIPLADPSTYDLPDQFINLVP